MSGPVTALDRMMNQQAAVVEAAADRDLTQHAADFVDASSVHLVGTGTSQHAAELGAELFGTAGFDTRWWSAVEFVRRGPHLTASDVVVVISHTTGSAYAVTARHRVLSSCARLVTVTGQDRNWPEAITIPTYEESETYTASYVGALAVLGRLAHGLGAPGLGPEQFHRVAVRLREILADPGVDDVTLPERAMAFVGPGPYGVTAREGALKMREGARMLCEGFDPERLLHGAAVPYTSADTLVVLQPDADVDGLTAAVAEAARGAGLAVTTLSESGVTDNPFLAQVPMTVRLQAMAARFARARGADPDTVIVGPWAAERLWRLGAPGTSA